MFFLQNSARISSAALTVSTALFCLPAIAEESAARVANTCFSSPQKSQQFLIAPYLFDPDIEGEAEVQGISAAFDYSVEDLASGINAGGMGYLLRERRPDFYMEGPSFRYKGRISAFEGKLLSAEITLFEFGYGRNYCVNSRQPNADYSFIIGPYIGLRHTQMDIPSLGVGYNDYWNIMAVLHLQATQHWSIAGGYRVTDFNTTPSGGNKIKMVYMERVGFSVLHTTFKFLHFLAFKRSLIPAS
jgi:hypothetical protein